MLDDAAKHGDMEFVQWLLLNHVVPMDRFEKEYTYECILKSAAKHGHLQVVRWLLGRMARIGLAKGPCNAMFAAAEGGSLGVVEWLYEQHSEDATEDLFQDQPDDPDNSVDFFPYTVLDAAAKNGHLDVLQFLGHIDRLMRRKRKDRGGEVREGLHCTTMAMDAAAEAGHLDVVKWLHENRPEGCTTKAMDRAAAQGHLEVVKWLHENRSEGCTTSAMDCAAFMQFHDTSFHIITPSCYADKEPDSFSENQLAVLEYLRANRSEGCTMAAMEGAVALGNLEVVRWLHENTTATCTTKAMDDAAGLGRLDLVKYLHENRAEGCTAHAMNSAAANGHLDVVKWLHENLSEGCVATAVEAAAGLASSQHNHLRMLQWLLSRDSNEVRLISAMGRALLAMNFEVALFLHAQHPTYCHIATLRRIRVGLSQQKRWLPACRIIFAWFDENYLPRAGQTERAC